MIPRLALVVAAGVVGVLVDVLVHAEAPGYGAAVGVAGTLLLTFGSQVLAAAVKRPNDYYDHVDLPAPTREAEDA